MKEYATKLSAQIAAALVIIAVKRDAPCVPNPILQAPSLTLLFFVYPVQNPSDQLGDIPILSPFVLFTVKLKLQLLTFFCGCPSRFGRVCPFPISFGFRPPASPPGEEERQCFHQFALLP